MASRFSEYNDWQMAEGESIVDYVQRLSDNRQGGVLGQGRGMLSDDYDHAYAESKSEVAPDVNLTGITNSPLGMLSRLRDSGGDSEQPTPEGRDFTPEEAAMQLADRNFDFGNIATSLFGPLSPFSAIAMLAEAGFDDHAKDVLSELSPMARSEYDSPEKVDFAARAGLFGPDVTNRALSPDMFGIDPQSITRALDRTFGTNFSPIDPNWSSLTNQRQQFNHNTSSTYNGPSMTNMFGNSYTPNFDFDPADFTADPSVTGAYGEGGGDGGSSGAGKGGVGSNPSGHGDSPSGRSDGGYGW